MNKKKDNYLNVMIIVLMSFGVTAQAQEVEQNEHVLKDRPVQMIERVPPEYPTLALFKRTEGWVKVAFTLTADNDITDVSVVDAEPKNVFEHAATEAVKKFKLLAPIKNGKRVEQRAAQLIEFEIPDEVKQLEQDYAKRGFMNGISAEDVIEMHEIAELPDDVMMVIKDMIIQSNIETDLESKVELLLRVKPDKTGRPESIEVVRNSLGEKELAIDIDFLKRATLASARDAYERFNGYYNPDYKITMAKNQPPGMFSVFEAKSMPVPEYSQDFVLNARLVIDETGQVESIKEATFFGEAVDPVLVSLLLDDINFTEARKNYEAVKDEVELKVVFSLVQKSDVEAIKKERMTEMKAQNID
jgi:TonB family C-terminal domain